MGLVLLPPEYILAAFERLMCAEFPNVSQLDRAKIFSFKKYMRKTWLNQFTPEILSVFGKPTATNNGAESFHKQLKEDITKHRPNVWVFVLKLSNILKDKHLDYERLQIHGEDEAFRKQRINMVTKLETRRQAEAKLLSGAIDPEDFLLSMSFHNENQVINLQKQFKSSKKPPTDPASDDMK